MPGQQRRRQPQQAIQHPPAQAAAARGRGGAARPAQRGPGPQQLWESWQGAQADRVVDPQTNRWRQLSADEAAQPGSGAAAGQRGHRATINGQTYQWDQGSPDTTTRARDMMGPSAQQFHSRALTGADSQGQQQLHVLRPDGTTSSQRANEHGMVELPEQGHGYGVYNRNDVRVGRQAQPDQWGTPESIARNINISNDYGTLFPGAQLEFGDLSTDTGNSPLLETGGRRRHGSHYEGSQADLRYIAGDGSGRRAATSGDSLNRQRSMVNIAESWGIDNFYASPSLRGKLFTRPGTEIGYNAGHADHLHMGRGSGHQH